MRICCIYLGNTELTWGPWCETGHYVSSSRDGVVFPRECAAPESKTEEPPSGSAGRPNRDKEEEEEEEEMKRVHF